MRPAARSWLTSAAACACECERAGRARPGRTGFLDRERGAETHD
jgi:hypothetical protein